MGSKHQSTRPQIGEGKLMYPHNMDAIAIENTRGLIDDSLLLETAENLYDGAAEEMSKSARRQTNVSSRNGSKI
ncbi:MAG: hypothetical protein IS860_06335 [Nitrosopumilus sp.]|nr:hypothetical protein [Nitrosopumilus sp.]